MVPLKWERLETFCRKYAAQQLSRPKFGACGVSVGSGLEYWDNCMEEMTGGGAPC